MLKYNSIAYRSIIIRDDFLLDETYDVPIAETTAADNLQRMIPSHAGHSKTWKVDAEIRTKNEKGYDIEVVTKSGLFTSPVDGRSDKHIAIEGSVNTWLKCAENGMNAIVHSDEMKNITGDMNWIIECYPTLFPEGITGPNVELKHKIEFDEWIEYWLRCYDDRFSLHYDFIFALYNIKQRRKALEQMR